MPTSIVIPDTGFVVDGFRHPPGPSISAYFLTHAHAGKLHCLVGLLVLQVDETQATTDCACDTDHYQGLSDTWRSGIIYCSEVTARLAVAIVQVSPDLLRPLPMNSPQSIQGKFL